MNITIHAANDKYSVYGLRHFLIKYGIFLSSEDKKSLFQLVPSSNNEQISYKNEITGWIYPKNKKIPVFGVPSDLTHKGKALLMYSDNDKKYPCVAATDEGIIIGLDVFKQIGYCLSGCLETVWMGIGKEKNNIIGTPFADFYGEILFDSLLRAYKKLNLPLVHKAFWPDGKKFAVCLTHDVDEIKKTYQWITYPLKLTKRHDLKGLYNQFYSLMQKIKGKEPYWNFEKIVKMEDGFGVKSSFFFLNETGKVKLLDKKTWRHLGRRYSLNDPKVASIIKELHSKGWDVGLHGSFYSYKDGNKLFKEKKALENVLCKYIHGIRQHNLNLKIPDTWLYQEKTGLDYDTTLGFNDCIGFRGGTCFPFRPFYMQENRALNIIEIPLIIEDTAFFRYRSPWEEFLKIVGEVEKHGGVLTLLWHSSVFNDHEYPGWSASYEKIIELCKKKNAWITSAREISDWCIWREKTSFEWDYEGTCLRIMPYQKKNNHFLNIYLSKEMIIKKISNAKVIEANGDLFIIRTNNLKNHECVEIEFSEWNHGN